MTLRGDRAFRLGAPACWLVASLLMSGCNRGLPDDPDDPADSDGPSDTDRPPVDTDLDGPAPRCQVEEVEPNNGPATATSLPPESRGCGTVGGPIDQDVWSFSLAEEAWLAVRVDAARLGSRADVQATLAGGTPAIGVTGFDRPDSADVRLVVPAGPGSYTLTVGPQGTQGGGEDSFYEVIASVTKPPLSADVAEGDNDDPEDPQVLVSAVTPPDGVLLVGRLEELTERDHYGVSLPAGRHRVVVTVEAQTLGSPLDVRMVVEDGTDRIIVEDSAFGASADPVWEGTYTGATILLLSLSASGGTAAPGSWYGLRVDVEAAL